MKPQRSQKSPIKIIAHDMKTDLTTSMPIVVSIGHNPWW